jgi:hypothetical protein
MSRSRRPAAALLAAGALIAAGTPAYLAAVSPDLAGYLLHGSLFFIQLIPFALCAVLWLPRKSRAARATALVLSAVMLLMAIVVYLPLLWSAGRRGGDMIALTFLATSAATVVLLLVGSVIGALVVRYRRRSGADGETGSPTQTTRSRF